MTRHMLSVALTTLILAAGPPAHARPDTQTLIHDATPAMQIDRVRDSRHGDHHGDPGRAAPHPQPAWAPPPRPRPGPGHGWPGNMRPPPNGSAWGWGGHQAGQAGGGYPPGPGSWLTRPPAQSGGWSQRPPARPLERPSFHPPRPMPPMFPGPAGPGGHGRPHGGAGMP